MRLPFQSIPSDSYLFASKIQAHGGLNGKEEPVRQWCAFELIRAYGVNIADLSFEEEVRVGSKIYRIDILVRRNGLPWIVVECKHPGNSKHNEGLDQAISYAAAVKVSAEYAVYTNGSTWLVKRQISGEWSSVPDIPVSGPHRPVGSIDELLRSIELASPLLHKLDEHLDGKEARLYLESLQRFFHGHNLITSGVDHDLRCATDLLLRVLSTGPSDKHYSRSKLSVAATFAEKFRAKTDIGSPLPEIHEGEHPCSFMPMLAACMLPLKEAGRDIGGVNQKLIKVMLSLLEYGRTQAHVPYPLFPAHLHQSLRSFLTKAMALSLDVQVPDALDEKFTSDMKSFTSSAWKNAVENDINDRKKGDKLVLQSLLPWRWFPHRRK